MTDKDKYRSLCHTETSIPLFSQDWWLDTVCGGEANWDVFIIERQGRIEAALPFYCPHKGIISMPPYTQTMGPWIASPPADMKEVSVLGYKQQLCSVFVDKLRRYPHFLQNFSHEITDWLPFYWSGYRQTTRYTYLLKDVSNTESLWENMSSNIRRNITKALNKHHIIIRRGVPIEDFLRIQALTFERQHLKNKQDESILKSLIDTCRSREQGDLWGGYDEEGKLHAVAFIAWQDESAYYMAGGGDPALRESGAHSLVLWDVIQSMAQYTSQFDFEGSMLPGVERFFREFGAIQTPYFTIMKGNLSLTYRCWLKLCRILKKH